MKKSENTEISSWLRDHARSTDVISNPLLKNLVPDQFDHYIAVLWPPAVIDGFPVNEIVVPSESIEQVSRNIEIWQSFGILYPNDNAAYRPTNYRELADLYNLDYNRQIINAINWYTRAVIIDIPATGRLLHELVDLLCGGSAMNLLIHNHSRWDGMFGNAETDPTYDVTTASFIEVMDKTFYDADLYLFPTDKSWCLINLEDLDFSLLAVNIEDAGKINDSLNLDKFEMSATDPLIL